MMKKGKRMYIGGVLLVMAMLLTLLPITAQATESDTPTEVGSFEGLKTAVAQGGSIKLTGNIDLTEVLIIGMSVDLDLNGFTIRQTAESLTSLIQINGGTQGARNTVYIRDTSDEKTGEVKCGNVSNAGITLSGGYIRLEIFGGTFSNESGYCVSNWGAGPDAYITLRGGTYLNSVSVNTIWDGTFQNGSGTGTTYVEAYNIHGGTCEAGTEAQMTEFHGGTFNGKATCLKGSDESITGGTFNGQLVLRNNVSYVSNCTIDGSLTWDQYSALPTFINVTFGENAEVTNLGYEIVDGQIQTIQPFTVMIATANKGMGEVSKYPSVDVINSDYSWVNSTAIEGGVGWKWEGVYTGASVKIYSVTATAKDGYKFVGWFDNEAGTGEPISTSSTLSYTTEAEGLQGDLSFYAVFEDDASYAGKVAAAEIWLGTYDSTNEYTINSEEDMEAFTVAVNYLGKDFDGKIVSLAANLTYTDGSFTPIGNSGVAFQGTFDGQGHTISGLSYSTDNKNSACVGLFGSVKGAEIKNLTLSGVNFSGGWMTGAFAGHAEGTTFTSCKLTGSRLSDAYFLGGIFGHGSTPNTVRGCTVENSTINGYWKTGGVAGYICGADISGTAVENTGFPGAGMTGALIGHANDGNTTLTDVKVTGVADGSQRKVNVVGTNYAGGTEHTISIAGDSTYVDAAGILPSTVSGNVTVSGGDFTFAIPEAYLPDSDGAERISVIFENDGEIVIVQVIEKGGTVTLPAAPSKEGYMFQGWYLENGTRVTERTTFTESTTVTAEWRANSTGVTVAPTYAINVSDAANGSVSTSLSNASEDNVITVTATPDEGYRVGSVTVTGPDGRVEVTRVNTTTYTFIMPDGAVSVNVTFTTASAVMPFIDVNRGDWFYDYVAYVYANGLMDGVSATQFNPDGGMTRAMLWTILARIDGQTVTGENWIETARAWAIAEGVSDGTDANGLVTREQFATMLWRYVGEPASSYSLSAYTDAASVSDWAQTAMQWAVENGIINGMSATTIEPQGSTIRTQAAAMLMRFVEL